MKVEINLSRESRKSLERERHLRISYQSRRLPKPLRERPDDAKVWAVSQVKDLSEAVLVAIGRPANKMEVKIGDISIEKHRVQVLFDLVLEECPWRGLGDWSPRGQHSAYSSDGVYHVRPSETSRGMSTWNPSLAASGPDQCDRPHFHAETEAEDMLADEFNDMPELVPIPITASTVLPLVSPLVVAMPLPEWNQWLSERSLQYE